MCTLLVYRRPVEGIELAVAANRDELHARPRGTWQRLSAEPEILGGHDPESGGTWLAVNSAGFVVAVTNARLGARRVAEQRSRGLLALDLVREASAEAAARRLEREDLTRYAAVNAVIAASDGHWLATNEPATRIERTDAMSLAVGNKDVFTPDERVRELLVLGTPACEMSADAYSACLKTTMARHTPPAACHHRQDGGTVASTIILLRRPFSTSLIEHADGAPCSADWQTVL